MEEHTGRFEVRQNLQLIGKEGGVIRSTFVPQIKIEIPEGALTKAIDAGVEVKVIEPELIGKHLGSPDAASPIVSIQPHRRKFHKAISLTVPFPKALSSVRLLYSVTAETKPVEWEDVTGAVPIQAVGDCLRISSTVTARFWYMECSPLDAARIANALYRESMTRPQKMEHYDLKQEDITNRPLPSDVNESLGKLALKESWEEDRSTTSQMIGKEGGVIRSTFDPRIELDIPEGALTKTLNVGVEVRVIEPELIGKHLGSPFAASPIVSIQPHRRKLHKYMVLTVPFPKALSSFRLLYSVTAENKPVEWEDVTGKIPIQAFGDCLRINSTVSARFWYMECSPLDAARIANALYRESMTRPQKMEHYDLKEDIDTKESQGKQGLKESGEEVSSTTRESQESSTDSAAAHSRYNIRCSPGSKTVVLERRSDGLGFSVAGGLHQYDIVPIFVEEIFVGGVAAEDGGLKRGDQILAVNGECLDGLTYQAAVTILKHALGKVNLTVCPC